MANNTVIFTLATVAVATAVLLMITRGVTTESYLPFGSPYTGWTNSYARLGSYGYDQPLFEPDVLRRCADGRFMYTSNPQLTDFCASVPAPMLARVACAKGFDGKPLYMSYNAPAYGCTRIPCRSGPGVCEWVG